MHDWAASVIFAMKHQLFMKILVPVDFSPLSESAARYALKLAELLQAEVILMHTVYDNMGSRAIIKTSELHEAMMGAAQEDMDELLSELKGEFQGLTIRHHLESSDSVSDSICSQAETTDAELIIMGSHGAGTLAGKLLGSNAAAVINSASIPVLVVPENAVFEGIRKLAYAATLREEDVELKAPAALAKILDAELQIVHVMTAKSSRDLDTGKTLEELKNRCGTDNLSLHLMINGDIAEGLEEFIREKKPDMLSLHTHELSFYEKVFGHGIARKMALHGSIPILAFRDTEDL